VTDSTFPFFVATDCDRRKTARASAYRAAAESSVDGVAAEVAHEA
jgi:hypothetical protein